MLYKDRHIQVMLYKDRHIQVMLYKDRHIQYESTGSFEIFD